MHPHTRMQNLAIFWCHKINPRFTWACVSLHWFNPPAQYPSRTWEKHPVIIITDNAYGCLGKHVYMRAGSLFKPSLQTTSTCEPHTKSPVHNLECIQSSVVKVSVEDVVFTAWIPPSQDTGVSLLPMWVICCLLKPGDISHAPAHTRDKLHVKCTYTTHFQAKHHVAGFLDYQSNW